MKKTKEKINEKKEKLGNLKKKSNFEIFFWKKQEKKTKKKRKEGKVKKKG